NPAQGGGYNAANPGPPAAGPGARDGGGGFRGGPGFGQPVVAAAGRGELQQGHKGFPHQQ
ncbi:MAG: hypothetical protein ACFCBW_07415, partial [Candidatus Competibacterales bacterium]